MTQSKIGIIDHTRSLSISIVRIILGIILLAHGSQKFFTWGLNGTTESFKQMGVPSPSLSATFAAVVEFAGGIFLILGLFIPLVTLLLIINLLGAIFTYHIHGGFFNTNTPTPGFEYPLTLILLLIVIGVTNHGIYSVDHHIGKKLFKKNTTTV